MKDKSHSNPYSPQRSLRVINEKNYQAYKNHRHKIQKYCK